MGYASAGYAARAELVLQPPQVDAVRGAIAAQPRHEVQPETAGTGGSALGTREQQDRVAVHVRAEPLLARHQDLPVIQLARGAMHGAAEVAPRIPFGEEHGPIRRLLERVGEKALHQLLADFLGCVPRDELRRAVGLTDTAGQTDVRLRQQVVHGQSDDGGCPAPASLAIRCEVGAVSDAPEGLLRVERRRVILDLVQLVRPAIVPAQLRRIRVDDIGVAGDLAADQRGEVRELRLGPGEVFMGAVAANRGLEVRIDLPPVQSDRGFEVRVVGHRRLRRPQLQPLSNEKDM
jgi:hypothetical protein